MSEHHTGELRAIVLDQPGGAQDFVHAYRGLPDGADIIFQTSMLKDTGATHVIVSFGPRAFSMPPSFARYVANVFEQAMVRFPDTASRHGFADMILGLRHTADEAERVQSETRPEQTS